AAPPMSELPTPPAHTRAPSLLQALIPLLVLVVLLAAGVALFGSDAAFGANQIALVL
ncbi:MAG TPA: Na+/H+ antiporter NhaC, partial [Xanthomonadaceae bacterium]|nr:Na+/H+ antiporter NhaC [Xanthomonadaceae bacterium]